MEKRLFPTDLPKLRWTEFSTEGFIEPVARVIYRTSCEPCCGVPLGGIGNLAEKFA